MTPEQAAAVARLRTPEAIRERCREILAKAELDELEHFRLYQERLGHAAGYVLETIEIDYPDLRIPFHSRWRHFETSGVDRWGSLAQHLTGRTNEDIARARIDLAVTSVLLDAGAGDSWRYKEKATGEYFTRSEGLALASLELFASGALSSVPSAPLQADAIALEALSEDRLRNSFQVRPDNELVGIHGRVALLRALGGALRASPDLFGERVPRAGNLYDYVSPRAKHCSVEAREILTAVLRGLAPIWPGRLQMGGENLGDVWPHPAIRRDDPSDGLVPFHKLSQWLTYSLVEPLQDAGLRIIGLDALTGLAEYRNGGLFVDLGVLELKRPERADEVHEPGGELVVEWRALTVALIDEIAVLLRSRLGLDAEELPLIKVLEGGTWSAGRRVARKHRSGGGPPIAVRSDGTIF